MSSHFFYLAFISLYLTSCASSKVRSKKSQYLETPTGRCPHLHSKNFIQQGPTLAQTYHILAQKNVERAAVFGTPLKQKWDMKTESFSFTLSPR